jgi:hypothetical protein
MKWETPMNGRWIAVPPSAYAYPLLIKQLLHTPLAQTAHGLDGARRQYAAMIVPKPRLHQFGERPVRASVVPDRRSHHSS